MQVRQEWKQEKLLVAPTVLDQEAQWQIDRHRIPQTIRLLKRNTSHLEIQGSGFVC